MRQRKIKNLDEKLAEYSYFSVDSPKQYKGKWNEVFGNDKPIYLEIGCGKGKFITDYAVSSPSKNFIAVEGNLSVVLRGLEKANEKHCENLKFVLEFIQDIFDYFEEGELAGIYLNFSDPWPKERHAKRRLTHGDRLKQYDRVIKPGGFIEFKTDNEGLFEFTLDEIERVNLEIVEISRDLHKSEFVAKNIMTEYEGKFSAIGKNINYVKVRSNV